VVFCFGLMFFQKRLHLYSKCWDDGDQHLTRGGVYLNVKPSGFGFGT